MDPRIADYIRQHRDRYTRDAIRQRLAEAGYDPAEIDATWVALETERHDQDTASSPRFWRYFWAWVAVTYLVAFVVVVIATGLLARGGMTPVALIYAVALGIALLAAWGIVAATRPTQLGRGTALAIGGVIPLVFALLVGGSCYGLIGTPPPPPRSGLMELHVEPPHAFDGSGAATCQSTPGGTGFGVRAENLGMLGGSQVSVSIDAFAGSPKAPDAPLPSGAFDQVSVYITLLPPSGNEPEAAYNNLTGSGLELDASAEGLVGTVTFPELSSVPVSVKGEPPGADSISGRVSWRCE
ncbi:MAG: hypothetical protein M3R49_00525 [Chloroflexota bacterium]|nr:hypothetical protein [Chloroflexota bacterium]